MTERVGLKEVSRPRSFGFVSVVRFFGWAAIWLGLFLLGFLVHQLFVTTFFAQQNNVALTAEVTEYFDEVQITEVAYTPPAVPIDPGTASEVDPETPSAAPAPPAILSIEAEPPKGEPFAIIRVPSLERLESGWAIVEGVSRNDLKNGVGHMPSTPLPGQPGNSVMSGHRTTYGAPFFNFDQLEPGDIIEVETAIGVHVYEIREIIIVKPTALWVTQPRDGAWLTLTTCNPRFSSRERLVVFAELIAGPNFEAINA